MTTTTMLTNEMYKFVQDRESRARTYGSSVDRVMAGGRLSRLWDTDGREYLDCLAVAGSLPLGHNHPAVSRAVRGFLDSGHLQQGLDLTTPVKYEFLRELYDRLPAAFAETAKVQFCGPTGADTAEAALKLLKTATGRRSVISFHGGYHGMTAGSLSLTGNRGPKENVASLMPDVHFMPYPYPYRCPFGIGGERGTAIAETYFEHVLRDIEGGITRPAAVFVEAVQGEGGVVPAPLRWLRRIREVTEALDIPLVLDEVQTGFGRTGTMFAFEAAGIVPDAIMLSKAVGGGYPLSVLLYHERYDRWWNPGAHAGTFRGNQVAMVAGRVTMETIAAEGLVERAAEAGTAVGRGLAELANRHPEIGDVRGRGLMWGVEIVDPAGPAGPLGSRPTDGAHAKQVKAQALENGLILETGGRHGSVVRLIPPLVLTDAEIAEMLDKLGRALDEASALKEGA